MQKKGVRLPGSFREAVLVIEDFEREVIVKGMLSAIRRNAEFLRERVVEHRIDIQNAKVGERVVRTRTLEFDDGSAFDVWFEYVGGRELVICGVERSYVLH